MAVVGAGRVAGPATVVAAQAVGGFELEFSLPGAARRCEPLPVCAGERFEDAVPARPFRFGKGLASFAGWWWMASTGRHVGFESWLERPVDRTNREQGSWVVRPGVADGSR